MSAYRRQPGTAVMGTDRWEQGSDFQLSLDAGSADLPWKTHPHGLWGSGRDALRALLARGRDAHGWRRLLAPSYFCQDVLPAVRLEIEVDVYESWPTRPGTKQVEVRVGDVVLVVATFGMRPSASLSGPATIVEDHSHDPLAPWAIDSRADYAIASLRKTLPLPDGGVLWSPRDLPVPPQGNETVEHSAAVLERLSAMILKLHYLEGHETDKSTFRALAIHSERAIGAGAISGISAFSRSRLPSLPTAKWREARARNLQVFRGEIGDLPHITLLDAPFAAILIFDDPARRGLVRERLIAARIYPSVLWPLEDPAVAGIPEAHVEMSRRVLSIHCDYRYTPDDMVRVASELRKALSER